MPLKNTKAFFSHLSTEDVLFESKRLLSLMNELLCEQQCLCSSSLYLIATR